METRAKILVAEDEETIRNNLVRLLRIEGYEVLAAENGEEALAIAREHLPALILSDVMMPRLDGHGLLVALRGDPLTATIPLVFLTALADRGDVREGMNLGADDYIAKPFQRDELLRTLEARLQRMRTQSEAQRRLQLEAQRLLHFDPLTQLPNRALLGERMQAAMSHAQRNRSRLALIMIGLDGFGRVNDSLGRAAGDGVLREVAARLMARVNGAMFCGAHDLAARVAGDEFAILLEGFGDDAYLDGYCMELIRELSQPFRQAERDIFLSACVGISLFDGDGDDHAPETLVQQAEAALRQAKQAGPGSRLFFSAEVNQQVSRRVLLHNELHRALELGQLSLYYQPQIDIASGKVAGCEALMRWQHPELGFVSPAEFIPIAEEGGLIVAMGTWALETAALQARAWQEAGTPVRVAVNLSARQFAQDELLGVVGRALAQAELTPELLELEITESIAMQDVEMVIVTLAALKSMGLVLAMDDFGTGYSSLSYLKRLPLDVLKVDQSFVRNMTTDPGDAAITRAVVAMAHSFGLSVIAEGVETEAHLSFLAELGCEVAQGYLFSKPLPVEAATRFFAERMAG